MTNGVTATSAMMDEISANVAASISANKVYIYTIIMIIAEWVGPHLSLI